MADAEEEEKSKGGERDEDAQPSSSPFYTFCTHGTGPRNHTAMTNSRSTSPLPPCQDAAPSRSRFTRASPHSGSEAVERTREDTTRAVASFPGFQGIVRTPNIPSDGARPCRPGRGRELPFEGRFRGAPGSVFCAFHSKSARSVVFLGFSESMPRRGVAMALTRCSAGESRAHRARFVSSHCPGSPGASS